MSTASRAARSVRFFAYYLFAIGGALLGAPNAVLPLLAIAPTREPWIRIVGFLAGVLGYYYLVLLRSGHAESLRATIPPRLTAAGVFIGLFVFGLGPAALVAFALIDLLGAVWTVWALRRDATAASVAGMSSSVAARGTTEKDSFRAAV